MIITVKLFAMARQTAGAEQIDLDVEGPATVGEVRRALLRAVPDLAPWNDHFLFAVDGEYAADDAEINAEAEVACIPPVSGG